MGTELPKPASSEGFEIPWITMPSASMALPNHRQLGILQGSRQELIQPSQPPRGRVGDAAQADTGGLIHPSSSQAKGGLGHVKGCPHPLSLKLKVNAAQCWRNEGSFRSSLSVSTGVPGFYSLSLLASQQNRERFHLTSVGKSGSQNRFPPATVHKNSLNNLLLISHQLRPGGHRPLCRSSPQGAAPRPRAPLAAPALAGRHRRTLSQPARHDSAR